MKILNIYPKMLSKRKPENVAFLVSVTPKRAKAQEEDLVAVLAPFNPFPKVEFENVKLNHEESREVSVINPTKAAILVELTKLPDPDQGFEFSSTEFEIPGERKTKLTIVWTPSNYGSARHNVKIVNKKTKKPVSELILITSTEEPPRRRLGCRTQTAKVKSTMTTNQKIVKTTTSFENKENMLISEGKNLTRMHNKETSVTSTQSEKNVTFSKTSTTVTNTKQASATASSVIFASESAGPSQRKLTYEVLTPEKYNKKPSYSLRNKAMSTVIEIEKEKLMFETIASPGLHNESLEKAASQLVEAEMARSNKAFRNTTFSCHEPVMNSRKSFARRETYEVLTPYNRQATVGERLAQAERSAWRSSIRSRDSSESLEDSLETLDKSLNRKHLSDNLDQFDFDCISLSTKENNSAKTPKKQVQGNELNPNKNIRNSFSPRVLLLDVKSLENINLDLTKTVRLNESFNEEADVNTEVKHVIVHEVIEQQSQGICVDYTTRDEQRSSLFSCDKRYSDSLNSESSKECMAKLMEIDSLEFSVSSSRRSSEIANSSSYSSKETFVLRNNQNSSSTTVGNSSHLEKSGGKHPEDYSRNVEKGSSEVERSFENNSHDHLEDLEKELCLSPIQHRGNSKINLVETLINQPNIASPMNHSVVLSNSFKHSSMIDIGCTATSVPSFSNISDLQTDKESKVQNEISDLTPKSTIEVKVEKQTDIHANTFYTSLMKQEQKSLEGFANFPQLLKQPVNSSEVSIQSDPCLKTSQSSTSNDAINLVIKDEPQVWDVSPPKKSKQDNESTELKSKKMPRVKSFLLTEMASKPSTKENHLTPLVVRDVEASSCGVFAVPTVGVKRTLRPTKSTNSPPKLRKVEVKRLSCTPNLQRKSIFITPVQRKRNDDGLSRSSRSSSAQKRKSIKVTSWLPTKLRLSQNSQSSESGVDSPPQVDLVTPNPVLAASSLNPFEKGGLYYSEEWLLEQELELLEWANRLLQPPSELQLHRDHKGTLFRLTALRGAAFVLLTAPDTQKVLSKIKIAVEKNIIAIRKDKQLHVDLGLQDQILGLLMNYNPLWLRLCLEAIYMCNIHLRCHADEAGLRCFIRENLLSDKSLAATYSHPTIPHLYLPEFEDKMKKFTLYKFLALVYLLDLVKAKKLMLHDPCLFKKDAKIKKSKEVLVEFNKELITGAGDINKKLRLKGYEVTHAQKYLDEYDYTLNCRTELRDGVRLTKLAEIITGNNQLLTKLRVPAISSLQKRHNAEIALCALKQAGQAFPDEITAKDIADGHKEKTLSLLWHLRGIIQKRAVKLIILKWQETAQMRHDRKHFLKVRSAIIKIQKWYRKKKAQKETSEELINKGKETRRLFLKVKSSTITIQRWYKRHLLAKKQRQEFLNKKSAVVCIQKRFRAHLFTRKDRNKFLKVKSSVISIQRKYRATVLMRRERQNYVELKSAVIYVQKTFRKKLIMKRERAQYLRIISSVVFIQRQLRASILMKKDRTKYLKIKSSVMFLQKKFRAKQIAKKEKENFTMMEATVVWTQRQFRANWLMKKERESFIKIRSAAICIQRRFRANLLMKIERDQFMKMRLAAVGMQRRYRANALMKKDQESFMKMRSATVCMQRQFRAKLLIKKEQEVFMKMRLAAVYIQRRFRANLLMKKEQENFMKMRSASICIQRRFRANLLMHMEQDVFRKMRSAAIYIQRQFRANRIRKKEQDGFIKMKSAVICIQRRFRANILMKKDRDNFIKKRLAALCVQRRVRANLLMKKEKYIFIKKRSATVFIQRRFRASLLMKKERDNFIKMRSAAVVIQRRFRANLLRNKEQYSFIKIRSAIVFIQRRFRGILLMKKERDNFIKVRSAAVGIQRRFRAYLLRKKEQDSFIKMNLAAVCIQRRFRANLLMKNEQDNFIKMRSAAVVIQRQFRANLLRNKERSSFIKVRSAVVLIQKRFRAILLMKKEKDNFIKMRSSAVHIQRLFRANLLRNKERYRFIKIRSAVVFIQRRFRAILLLKKERKNYKKVKLAAVCIQRQFRAYLLRKKEQDSFIKMKLAAVCIQRRFRASLLMKNEQDNFIKMKLAAVCIQRRLRANLLRNKERSSFIKIRWAVVLIQKRFRAILLMKKEKDDFIKMRSAAAHIQRRFRANLLRNKERSSFIKIRSAVVFIQKRFRAILLMKKEKDNFIKMRSAAVHIQRRFRANLLRNKEQDSFIKLKSASICIQRSFRANLLMQNERANFIKMRSAAVHIQRRFRANLLRKKEQDSFIKLKSAAICIQRSFRANLLMQNERANFIKMRSAAVHIQRRFRANLLRKKEQDSFIKLKSAAICIQRSFRANLLMQNERANFIKMRSAAVHIQRRFLAILLRKKEQDSFIKLKSAAICIQRSFRANLLMQNERANFIKMRSAAVHIQRRFRANLLRKKEQDSFIKLKSAALCIQRSFRANLLMQNERSNFIKMRLAAVCVQRRFRANLLMKKEKDFFMKRRSAAVLIQSRLRAIFLMTEERDNFRKMRSAAVFIQRRFRNNLSMKKERDNFIKMRSAAVCIQRLFRANLLMKKEREHYAKTKKAVLFIQRSYRANFVLKRAEEYFYRKAQEEIAECEHQKRVKAAIAMQAIWRGRQVRRRVVIPEPEEGPADKKRYQETLNTRGQFFLEKIKARDLLNSITVAQMHNILLNLDVLTVMSADQCNYFANNGVVSVLFSIINKGNKASGVDQCTELCFMILCNLYRAPATKDIVWQDTLQCNGLESLLDIMLKNRHDKRNSIFCKAFTLLWLFVRDPAKAEVMKKMELMASLKYVWKDRAKLQQTQVQVKTKKAQSTTKQLPSVKENWGRYFRNHLRAFEDKFLALQTVCQLLNVQD